MGPAAGSKAETQRAQTPQAAPRAAFARGRVPSLGSDLASPERTRSFPSILAARAHSHCHAETGERGGCLRAGGCRSVTHRSRAATRSRAPRQAGAPLAPRGEAARTNPRQVQDLGPQTAAKLPLSSRLPCRQVYLSCYLSQPALRISLPEFFRSRERCGPGQQPQGHRRTAAEPGRSTAPS